MHFNKRMLGTHWSHSEVVCILLLHHLLMHMAQYVPHTHTSNYHIIFNTNPPFLPQLTGPHLQVTLLELPVVQVRSTPKPSHLSKWNKDSQKVEPQDFCSLTQAPQFRSTSSQWEATSCTRRTSLSWYLAPSAANTESQSKRGQVESPPEGSDPAIHLLQLSHFHVVKGTIVPWSLTCLSVSRDFL